MSVTLAPQTEERLRLLVERGQYASVDEALDAAVALLDERNRLQQLQVALSEAETETNEGRVAEWTPELRARLRQDALARSENGDKPGPHVAP